jgi:transcriptional regulator with XRE-family HTH domain
MRRRCRAGPVLAGRREAAAIVGNLGRETRTTRRRRGLSQAALAERVGLCQSEISYLERGHGARTSIEVWVAIGLALRRPIAIGFGRDVADPLQDAGHLAAQELVIRRASAAGWHAQFEAPTSNDAHVQSTDVLLTNGDRVVLIEIWNRLDDLGAAARSTDRKLAARRGGNQDVGSCWVLLDTAANRSIVQRYPAILQARFPGSSQGWVRAIEGRQPMPTGPGIAWLDIRSDRLRPIRFSAP